jgi:outer membrane protein
MGHMSRTMRYAVLTLVVSATVLLSGPVRAEEDQGRLPLTYTLDDCLHIALRQSPGILAAGEEVKKAKGIIGEVWASILTVNADASYNYLETPQGMTLPAGSLGPGLPPTGVFLGNPAHDYYKVGVEGTLPVFTGGRVTSGIMVAYLTRDIAFEGYRKAINDTLYNVRVAFWSIVLAREVVKVRTDALDLLTRHLETTRKKYDVGVVSRFDVLRAEVEVANARPPLIAAKNDLKIAGESLKRVLGIDSNEPFEIEGALAFVEEPVDLDGMLAAADTASPELSISRKSERIAKKNVNMTIGEFLPTISTFARYEGDINDFSWNEDDWTWEFTAGIMVSIPLTDLAVTATKLKQANADYHKAKIGLLDTTNKVRIDVKTAYYDLLQAREIVESQRLNIDMATEALKIAEVRYENGISTLLELMDAQLALTTARLNYLNALFSYEESKARLKKITGAEGPKD